MKIAILGSGNMGSALARRITAAGHDVLLTSKDLTKAEKVARGIGTRITVVPPSGVWKEADLLIAATPADSQAAALRETGDVTGRIIVDIANPIKPDYSGLTVGHTTSFAEELARALPGARIVKAFNTVFARVIAEGPDFGKDRRAAVFYAGDDEEAKKKVHTLIESMGFDAVDSGPLQNARYLEPMGMLNIWFGYTAKRGTDSVPTWISRSGETKTRAA
jgi:hypothetical protein